MILSEHALSFYAPQLFIKQYVETKLSAANAPGMQDGLDDILHCDSGALWEIPLHLMLNKPGQSHDNKSAGRHCLVYNGSCRRLVGCHPPETGRAPGFFLVLEATNKWRFNCLNVQRILIKCTIVILKQNLVEKLQ